MATARADTPSLSNEYPIPHRMKAWVLGGPEELALIEKPVPQPGPAEVLVRVDAIAVCATDSRKRLLARSALPHAAGRTAPVRAVVFTCAERFRPFQEAGNPRLAHGLLDASTVEGADHRLADEDAAEQGALTLGNAAPDHFAGNGALAGFQIGYLTREVAVFVGEIAGTEVVER
jgi:hypothetical protein